MKEKTITYRKLIDAVRWCPGNVGLGPTNKGEEKEKEKGHVDECFARSSPEMKSPCDRCWTLVLDSINEDD